jgi:very-short-patch-repair endonuclease
MRLDDQLEALSMRQHACVGIWQLRELGASSTEVSRLRASRRWEAMCSRVLRVAGSPRTEWQTAMASVLEAGPGGRLSHQASAALWGVGSSYRLLPPTVMGPYGEVAHRGELGHIHPLVDVPERWLTIYNDIPVVRPELCVYQLCGSVPDLRAERALDTAWSMGLVSGRSLRACLDDLARRGRNGTVLFRQLLEVRPSAYVPPATGLEARFQQIMTANGIGEWRRQVDSGGEVWGGRVDFRRVDVPVIAEVQSERFHAALSFRADDAERRARLEAAGFVVAEVWDTQVWHRPGETVAIVEDAVRRVRRRVA